MSRCHQTVATTGRPVVFRGVCGYFLEARCNFQFDLLKINTVDGRADVQLYSDTASLGSKDADLRMCPVGFRQLQGFNEEKGKLFVQQRAPEGEQILSVTTVLTRR